jgi:hypothetical protein
LDVGEAGIGQGLRLEVHVPEAAGPIEGQLGPSQQLDRVVDVTTEGRHRHPALLDAGRLVLDQAGGPQEPGPSGGLVAAIGGEQISEVDARQRRLPLLPGGGEPADGRREVRDGRLEVIGLDGLADQRQVPRLLPNPTHAPHGRAPRSGPDRQAPPAFKCAHFCTPWGVEVGNLTWDLRLRL